MDNQEYVMLKSYDNKLVKVPIDKKDVYIKNQEEIKYLLSEGKSIKEVLKIMSDRYDK